MHQKEREREREKKKKKKRRFERSESGWFDSRVKEEDDEDEGIIMMMRERLNSMLRNVRRGNI